MNTVSTITKYKRPCMFCIVSWFIASPEMFIKGNPISTPIHFKKPFVDFYENLKMDEIGKNWKKSIQIKETTPIYCFYYFLVKISIIFQDTLEYLKFYTSFIFEIILYKFIFLREMIQLLIFFYFQNRIYTYIFK